ncbi:hypothetical protein ACJX0J_033807, partial [Zea mays]
KKHYISDAPNLCKYQLIPTRAKSLETITTQISILCGISIFYISQHRQCDDYKNNHVLKIRTMHIPNFVEEHIAHGEIVLIIDGYAIKDITVASQYIYLKATKEGPR